MSSTTYGFLLTTLAGLSTMIGTVFVLWNKKKKETILIKALAFAAGVMLCVSFSDLIPESFAAFQTNFFPFPSLLMCFIFVVIGILISMAIDTYLPENKTSSNHSLYRVGFISMLAIILHNLPEGIATFLTAHQDTSLGLTLAIAIALHNIPEGISISIPIYYATGNKKKALLYTLLSGLSEPIGALLAYLFLAPFMNDFIMGILYALIAGIMFHIALYELLKTSFQYQKPYQTISFFIIGLLFMMISHILFL